MTVVKFEPANVSDRTAKKYAERLLTVAAIIKSIKPYQYDHGDWISKFDPAQPENTIGCALGHAVANKELFPGLELHINVKSLGFRPQLFPDNPERNAFYSINEAATKYFGPLSWAYIFGGLAFRDNVSKKTVVKRIEQFVRERYGYEAA